MKEKKKEKEGRKPTRVRLEVTFLFFSHYYVSLLCVFVCAFLFIARTAFYMQCYVPSKERRVAKSK